VSTLTKLESDYKGFVENIERMATIDIEKIRNDLTALKEQASQFSGPA